jgi:hypothetical protein
MQAVIGGEPGPVRAAAAHDASMMATTNPEEPIVHEVVRMMVDIKQSVATMQAHMVRRAEFSATSVAGLSGHRSSDRWQFHSNDLPGQCDDELLCDCASRPIFCVAACLIIPPNIFDRITQHIF